MSAYSPITPWRHQPGSPPEAREASIDTRQQIGPQFQNTRGARGQMSNWDRCNWCGMPRSSHGINWSCPTARTTSGRHFAAFVALAGLLAVTGIGLLMATSQTSSSLGSLGAAVLLSGLVVLICTGTIVSRRS